MVEKTEIKFLLYTTKNIKHNSSVQRITTLKLSSHRKNTNEKYRREIKTKDRQKYTKVTPSQRGKGPKSQKFRKQSVPDTETKRSKNLLNTIFTEVYTEDV